MKCVKNIHFKGYKAFSSDEYADINNISQVNVIIGKNNSGKTSMLDVIELVYSDQSEIRPGFDIDPVAVDIEFDREMGEGVFSGGLLGIGNWNKSNFVLFVDGKVFPAEINASKNIIIKPHSQLESVKAHLHGAENVIKKRRLSNKFYKISAERNICPEIEESDIRLEPNGDGATNLIKTIVNDSSYDESIIESKLLGELNKIMIPDAEYESIRVQQFTEENVVKWEVFLKEKGMKRVPLSKTGSGLKTIVLVLLNLIVLPEIKGYKGYNKICGFEELENNLHPALQRRLFDYIYQYAVENDTIVFLTTHSHIAINAFFDKEKAALYHVIKEDGKAGIKCIESHIDKTEILDDLDVKASDILQSNGIIWVEGPSDRIYIKRWMELFTDNKYVEGRDYQFLYYGGRLLSQYSADEETELVNIITTNRNAAIVIDSDKRYANTPLNNTKQRIIAEFSKLNMFSWVTKGKEIENYLPKDALEQMLNTTIKKQCGRFELFPQYVDKYYNRFANKKVTFANEIKAYLTAENTSQMMDVKKQIILLYQQIERWNK